MKMPWNQEAVHILPIKIDLSCQPWCREALLLHVRGTGVLRWEARTLPPGADPYEAARCLTLRGTPLLSWQAPVCETSESWLCAGWGLDTAAGPETEALRGILNNSFACLKSAVPALSPLLELLPEGVYVLAEGDVYPAGGDGRFFWDVPDRLVPHPATRLVYLNDDDFDCQYQYLPPVFLYPSRRRSRLDWRRVDYYKKRFQQNGSQPHGIALHVVEGLSLLLDGHHKAAAAALLGRTLPCLTVLRLEHYQLRPVLISGQYTRSAGCFGPITVPIKDMGRLKLPEKPWKFPDGPGSLPEGRLEDAALPEALLTLGKQYPTAEEYALTAATEIGHPTDEELKRWLADPSLFRSQLRAALVALRSQGDLRLKKTALRCAAAGGPCCCLKTEAFRVLAALKGDPEVEAFFIDYFVSLEESPGTCRSVQDDLTEIAHSFWE